MKGTSEGILSPPALKNLTEAFTNAAAQNSGFLRILRQGTRNQLHSTKLTQFTGVIPCG